MYAVIGLILIFQNNWIIEMQRSFNHQILQQMDFHVEKLISHTFDYMH